jgi:hypothetical protein
MKEDVNTSNCDLTSAWIELWPYLEQLNVSGCRHGSGPPVHRDSIRCYRSMSSPPATFAVSCSFCVPLPLCPLGPASFLSLCALGLLAVAWALSSFELPGFHHTATTGHCRGVHLGGKLLQLRP